MVDESLSVVDLIQDRTARQGPDPKPFFTRSEHLKLNRIRNQAGVGHTGEITGHPACTRVVIAARQMNPVPSVRTGRVRGKCDEPLVDRKFSQG